MMTEADSLVAHVERSRLSTDDETDEEVEDFEGLELPETE